MVHNELCSVSKFEFDANQDTATQRGLLIGCPRWDAVQTSGFIPVSARQQEPKLGNGFVCDGAELGRTVWGPDGSAPRRLSLSAVPMDHTTVIYWSIKHGGQRNSLMCDSCLT
ncbi:unnamed protein product [Arctogadus glacialis]